MQRRKETARRLNDIVGEAGAVNNLGKVYEKLGQIPKALECFQEAVSLYQRMHLEKYEAFTLVNIGDIYSESSQSAKALEHFQQALILCQRIGDKDGEARKLTGIGIVYADKGEPQKALEFLQKAVPLIKQDEDKARTLTNMGLVTLRDGKWCYPGRKKMS